jgi:hypothetical protein
MPARLKVIHPLLGPSALGIGQARHAIQDTPTLVSIDAADAQHGAEMIHLLPERWRL